MFWYVFTQNKRKIIGKLCEKFFPLTKIHSKVEYCSENLVSTGKKKEWAPMQIF